MADALGDLGGRTVGERQHLVVHVDADDTTARPDDLAGQEADLAGAAAQVEHRLAFAQVCRGVTAAVVALQDLARDGGEQGGIVLDRAAQALFAGLRGLGVAGAHGLFDLHGRWVRRCDCGHLLYLRLVV